MTGDLPFNYEGKSFKYRVGLDLLSLPYTQTDNMILLLATYKCLSNNLTANARVKQIR
jgi:hypothetical protein